VTNQLWSSIRRSRTPATFALLGVIAIGYLAQLVFGDSLVLTFAFYPPLMWSEPWRLITSAFIHSGIMHVMFNGYSLWVLGNLIERVLGPARFLLVFAVSVIAGCLAVFVLSPESLTVGASAGIFGLFATLFMINRGFGGNNVSLLAIIGLNLAIGFIVPGIAWEAHIGGLIGGFVTTLIIRRARR
jgi:membrane associated rhomboid family serine protease